MYFPSEPESLHGEKKTPLTAVRDGIEMHDVTFTYGCRGSVLEKLSLYIPAGATVGIIGESGSGKSTFLKLLMRFYDPTEGRLSIDGLDLRDYDLASLRSAIGLVSPDPFIFNGTVYNNIVLGRSDATMKESVARCCS